jgi:hypothetical protein
MKKTLILSLVLVALAMPFAPIPAKAQTFSVEQQATLDTLRQQLIDLLLQQIAMLQAKIDEILAKQAQAPIYQAPQVPIVGAVEPVVMPDVTTLTPGSIRSITKVMINGGERNEIALNLNDAFHVYMGTRCPGNPSSQDNASYITRAMYPDGYGVIFRYGNVGECSYKLRSADQFGRDIPTSQGDLSYGTFTLE